MTAVTPGRYTKLLERLDAGARHQDYPEAFGASWTELCSDAAAAIRRLDRLASKPSVEVQRQLDRANKIIAWMMPYIGTMCPPQNGLGELNDHCVENSIRPNFDDETKGRPINQSGMPDQPRRALSKTEET